MILLVYIIFFISCIKECTSNQIIPEYELVSLDNNIETLKKMSFLNPTFSNKRLQQDSNSQKESFELLKLKKHSVYKLDVTNQIKKSIQQNKTQKQANKSQFNNYWDEKQRVIQGLQFMSTFGIPAKRYQGLSYYNYLAFNIFNNFYTIEGDKISSIEDYLSMSTKPTISTHQKSNLLISSTRNQNFVIAQYLQNKDYQQNNCQNIKISHVQLKNKELVISDNEEYKKLIIQATNQCTVLNNLSIYNTFFVFYIFSNKKTYYIFSNQKQIHFYIYNEKAEKLVLDHNRTIDVNNIFDNSQHEIGSAIGSKKSIKIQKIIKLSTFLVILTSNNHLFTINLMNYLGSKRKQWLTFYESISSDFQNYQDIKINDNDYRYFYIVTNFNVYMYQLSQSQIIKKYNLPHLLCLYHIKSMRNNTKCTKNVHILQNQLLIQIQTKQYQEFEDLIFPVKFYLIQKSNSKQREWIVPFSHQRKCSQLKKIFVTKNKNSNYIVTLACFLQQSQSFRKVEKPFYLIFQHLSLQTSDEILGSGQLNGIDFSKFRLPLIIFSIGLIFYITFKKSSKKTPQQIAQEQKLNKKFEQEIMEKIKKQTQKKQSLQNTNLKL